MRRRRLVGRTLARSQALQLLFQAEATGRSVDEVLSGPYALSEGPLDEFGEMLARGADGMRHDLDAIMADASTNWGVSRMPAVDRNLLRLSLYEMLVVDEVDVAVTIDECVELAKAYGTDESSRFVNGLLGNVAARLAKGADFASLVGGAPGPEAASDAAEDGDSSAGLGAEQAANGVFAAE